MEETRIAVFLRSIASISARGLVISIAVSALIAAICWLMEWRTFQEFAIALQYGAMAVLALGSITAAAQSPIGPRYREIAKYMPLTRTARDPEIYKQMIRERSSGLIFLWIAIAAAAFLYVESSVIFRLLE